MTSKATVGKRCGHENWLAHSWWDGAAGLPCQWIEEPYMPRKDAALILCVDCHEILPLGPARDTPETAVEVRAAEIADLLDDADTLCDWSLCNLADDDEEWRGWSLAETNMQQHSNRYQSGYLARCISTHPTGADHE